MAPDFILGGIMKSGTTLLHNLFIEHPSIQMLDRNLDYSFFDDDRVYKHGFEWYQNLFTPLEEDRKDGELIGQTSADCAFNPSAVDRIVKLLPDTKLIFVLRHPVQRTYSLYWHQYSMAREHLSFEKAIELEPKRIQKSYYHFKHYSFVERSRYKKQFEHILRIVPKEQIRLLPFDALVKDTLPTVNILFDFLKVNRITSLDDLNFQNLPKNSARIPSNRVIVKISAHMQRLGMLRAGRRLVNMFRIEQRPPEMKDETRRLLNEELSEDIEFYDKIKNEFYQRIDNLLKAN